MTTVSGRLLEMTPREYAESLAATAPPLTDAQVESAARLLASVDEGRAA